MIVVRHLLLLRAAMALTISLLNIVATSCQLVEFSQKTSEQAPENALRFESPPLDATPSGDYHRLG